METTRIALIQYACAGSREATAGHVAELIAQAVSRGARLICLPEFTLTPYFPSQPDPAGIAWAEPLHDGPSDRFFRQQAAAHGVAIISSIFEQDGAHYFDTAVLHQADGTIAGATRKVHLPSGVGYNEPDFFGPGEDYPVHTLAGLRVAAPTCYDQWFPEMARICALNGAEFIFYPTAIGSEPTDPAVDSADAWQTVMRGHAVANGCFIAAANRIGHEEPVTFYGSSFICDPMGRVIAQAGRDTTEVLIADLNAGMLTRWRGLFPLLHQRRPETYSRLVDPKEG